MKILMLAGTAEARQLAGCLGRRPDRYDLTASLAGETRQPQVFPCNLRVGGFGGEAGLVRFLVDGGFERIVDATHPFARYPRTVARAAQQTGIPCLRFLRPPWPRRPHWQMVDDLDGAARALPAGCRALLATGRKSARAFAGTKAEWLGLRVVDPCDTRRWSTNGVWLDVPANPTVEDERAVMSEHRVTHLVCKNSGGRFGLARLDAADQLGVTTIMIRRPGLSLPPDPDLATSIPEALRWLDRMLLETPSDAFSTGPEIARRI